MDKGKKDFNGIWFTWCNKRAFNRRIYCRLDRIYVNLHLVNFIHPLNCTPVLVTPASISDHSPIYAHLVLVEDERVNVVRKNGLFKLNTALLQEEGIEYKLYSISIMTNFYNKEASTRDKWSLKVDSWKKVFQIMGCKLAKDKRRNENLYQRKLNNIEKELQDKGKDIELEKELCNTLERLRSIQNFKFQG